MSLRISNWYIIQRFFIAGVIKVNSKVTICDSLFNVPVIEIWKLTHDIIAGC